MDGSEIARRLDAQERILLAIIAAVAPMEADTEGSGFEDLIEVLADLTEAVADVTQAVQALRSDVSARFPSVAG